MLHNLVAFALLHLRMPALSNVSRILADMVKVKQPELLCRAYVVCSLPITGRYDAKHALQHAKWIMKVTSALQKPSEGKVITTSSAILQGADAGDNKKSKAKSKPDPEIAVKEAFKEAEKLLEAEPMDAEEVRSALF